jgi:ribosome-binding factor A
MHQRTDRVASLLIREVSQAVREDIQDSDIGFITFIRSDVAKDLHNANIFYSVLGTAEEKQKTDLAIQRNAKEIKRIVNDRMQLRYAIEIRFIREEGIDHAFRVDEILNKIRAEREAKEPKSPAEAEFRPESEPEPEKE